MGNNLKMGPLKIETISSEELPEVNVISFKGKMGYESIKKIRRAFDKILAANNFFVIANMSDVESISLAAIGELMGFRKQLIEKDGDLVMAGLKVEVKEKLNSIDANKIFKFYNNIRSAVNFYYWEYQGQIEKILLSFPPELSFVPPVRQLVKRIARQKEYGKKDAFRIETIVDEICNNAIEHGKCSEYDEINVSIAIDRKKIEINISNASDPVKIEKLKKVLEYISNSENPINDTRGRGLALVKKLSNEFQIDNSKIGTCVHVTKLRED